MIEDKNGNGPIPKYLDKNISDAEFNKTMETLKEISEAIIARKKNKEDEDTSPQE